MYPIDEMPILVATLGKYRVERIRYHQKGTGRRQPAATNIPNTVQEAIAGFLSPYEYPIENILHCFAQADDVRECLSMQRLLNIFQCIPVINTREVQVMMSIDARQAQRYVRAAKHALPFLEKVLLRKKLK